MDNAIYTMLTRQAGLLQEFDAVANNIANADTTGYKKENAVFSEYIMALSAPGVQDDAPSLSMGRLSAHTTDFTAGSTRQTGGSLDVAIQGEGFFVVNVQGETQLTRDGHFIVDADGQLTDDMGNPVLNEGQGIIQIPPEAAEIKISSDGTISAGDAELGRLGVVSADPLSLSRKGGNYWQAQNGFQPIETPVVLQGFLEESNVNPVIELSRMIEVQRYYDSGQKILEIEDERIRDSVRTVRQLM